MRASLSLVWSTGVSIWVKTVSSPSQRRSSTDSRDLSKERGRETRHARQHASLSSLRVAGGTYLRLVRARAGRDVATRIPTDAREPPRPLSCVVRRDLFLEYNALNCVSLSQKRIKAIPGYRGPRVTCVVSFVHLTCVPRACLRAHAPSPSLSCAAQTTSSGPQRTRRRSVWSLPRAKKV